jgi:hypothetical protein
MGAGGFCVEKCLIQLSTLFNSTARTAFALDLVETHKKA